MRECELITGGHTFGLFAVKLFLADFFLTSLILF